MFSAPGRRGVTAPRTPRDRAHPVVRAERCPMARNASSPLWVRLARVSAALAVVAAALLIGPVPGAAADTLTSSGPATSASEVMAPPSGSATPPTDAPTSSSDAQVSSPDPSTTGASSSTAAPAVSTSDAAASSSPSPAATTPPSTPPSTPTPASSTHGIAGGGPVHALAVHDRFLNDRALDDGEVDRGRTSNCLGDDHTDGHRSGVSARPGRDRCRGLHPGERGRRPAGSGRDQLCHRRAAIHGRGRGGRRIDLYLQPTVGRIHLCRRRCSRGDFAGLRGVDGRILGHLHLDDQWKTRRGSVSPHGRTAQVAANDTTNDVAVARGSVPDQSLLGGLHAPHPADPTRRRSELPAEQHTRTPVGGTSVLRPGRAGLRRLARPPVGHLERSARQHLRPGRRAGVLPRLGAEPRTPCSDSPRPGSARTRSTRLPTRSGTPARTTSVPQVTPRPGSTSPRPRSPYRSPVWTRPSSPMTGPPATCSPNFGLR